MAGSSCFDAPDVNASARQRNRPDGEERSSTRSPTRAVDVPAASRRSISFARPPSEGDAVKSLARLSVVLLLGLGAAIVPGQTVAAARRCADADAPLSVE